MQSLFRISIGVQGKIQSNSGYLLLGAAQEILSLGSDSIYKAVSASDKV